MIRRARHISSRSRTRHRLGRWFDFFAGRRSRPRGSRTSQSQTVGRTCLLEPLEDRRLLTDISGPIPDGSVWDDVTEPYHIIADATLAAGHTLTIEPGVEVISDHFEPLKIYGTVEADEVEFSGGTEISVEAGGRLDLANGTTMDGRFVRYKTGSFGDIADTTFSTAQLILLSGDVTLSNQNNTYSSDEPVSTLPSLVPEFHGSTFDAASDATIYVGGTTEGTANWIPMGSVNRYEIDGAITVAAGTSLTIESGLEVFTANGQSIKVLGSFAADGVDFTGRTLIRVEDGGRVDLSGASSVAGTSVEYKEGSLGDIADTTFSTAQLQLYSSSVTLRGQNNTFSNTEPVFTYPSLVPELFDNTFNSPDDPAIFIEGTTEGTALWKPIGNVQRYHVDSGMRVAAGTTLTIEPGVEVYSDTWVTIRVFGTLAADGVDFTGSTEMTAEAGGRLDLSGSSVAGNLVEYAADSLGSLADTTFTTAQLQLYSTDVTLLAQNNTFTGTEPVDAYPSVVPELFDSIFTAGAAATIYIQGKTEGVASWSPIGEVTRYYIHQDVTVMAGTTLTIQAGVEVSSRTDRDIRVNGTLTADGVDFTGDTLIWVRDGGRADLSGGTTVEGDELRYWDGSLGDVSDTTFTTAQLKLYSAGVSLRDQNNTFTGTEPASAYSSLVPELFGNTFNSVAPATIFVQRTTEGSAIWKPIGSVSRYALESGVRVAVGDTLIIEPGLEIFSPHNLDIQALGTLQAEGVDFTGETILLVPDGGRLDLSGGTTVAGEYVHYRWNSLGSITDTTFTTAQLKLHSSGVSLRGQNNTFTGTEPVYTYPSLVPELYDNAFTAGAAGTILIRGDTDENATWRPIGELNRYRLELWMTVERDHTLTIEPGVEVITPSGIGLTLRGTLVASGVEFTGDTAIGVWDRLELRQSSVSGSRLEYLDGSTGKVRYTNLGLPVTINSGSTVSVLASDFSDGTVIAEGPAGTTIPLGGNYWGTVDPVEIEAKITHEVDDPSLPLVIFDPWLTQPPSGQLLYVTSLSPDSPAKQRQDHLDVTFNRAVDLATFTPADCLIHDGNTQLVPLGISHLAGTTYRLQFAGDLPDGEYAISIGPEIADAAGHAMDQDLDANLGEPVDDVFSTTLLFDATPPTLTDHFPPSETFLPFDQVELTFSEPVDGPTFTTADVTMTGPQGPIIVERVFEVAASDGRTFRVHFPEQATNGAYQLEVGPNVTDLVGNPMAAAATVSIGLIDDPTLFRVTDVTPEDCGFSVSFNLPVDVDQLNLYDGGHHLLGPADVTLIGASGGPVAGSLLVTDSGQRVTFVRTGGPLEPDTYTLRLKGEPGGIVSVLGSVLDGDEDRIAGGDFVTTFIVADADRVVVSLPDFMRGPGQPVDVPAIDDGIALRLSDTANVDLIDLTLTYDPALLTIVEVNKGPTVPADALLQVNHQTPGQLQLSLSPTTPLPAGPLELVTLEADVPATATYGEIQILDFTSVRINDGAIPAVGDDAVHVVGYLGDATGNGGYSGLDAQRVARVGVGLDSGFADWPRVDPLIVGDVTGKDGLSGFDAQRIAREVVGLHSPEIPAIPQPQRLAIPSNRSRQTLDETDRSFAVPTGLTRVWEGEAPAEPHSGSASGSAGASPSRLPPPNITQPYVDRADLLTAVLDERDYVLGDGDEQDDRGKETGIRGVWDEGSLDDDISARLNNWTEPL